MFDADHIFDVSLCFHQLLKLHLMLLSARLHVTLHRFVADLDYQRAAHNTVFVHLSIKSVQLKRFDASLYVNRV